MSIKYKQLSGVVSSSLIGASSGIATLDSNSKLNSSQIPSITLSGDISGSGTSTITTTLATQGSVTSGTYFGLTINTKGLITATSTGLVTFNAYNENTNSSLTGASISLSFTSSSNIYPITLADGANTITLPNTSSVSSNTVTTITLRIINAASGTYTQIPTINWATFGTDSLAWDQTGSTSPNPATGASGVTIYTLSYFKSDTTWYGSRVWMSA